MGCANQGNPVNTKTNGFGERKKRKQRQRGRHVDIEVLDRLKTLLGEPPYQRSLLIEYLHKIQQANHFIHSSQLVALAELLKLPHTEPFEVASFYHHFDIVKDDETPPPSLTVRVCNSLSCSMADAAVLIDQLQQTLGDNIRIQPVPCVGRCAHAPVAVVGQNPIHGATLAAVQQAIDRDKTDALPPDNAIYFKQYRAQQGYDLLLDCMQSYREVEDILELLEDSGLRGLGGAGFPAGRKWRILREQPAPRYLAVNIDEGEPGAFKDRYFLERDPHRMIEGALIAAWAIEASDVYFYIRDEYAGLHRLLQQELDTLQQALELELPMLHLRRGAGAYICGEESAMIESLEGKRGMPRHRPPYLAQVGLFGRPTLEHNMETLYWLRDIIEHGADWFNRQGRHGRSGLRSFSVSGRVNKPGVHIAPAGITLQQLIEEYCGGMQPGHELYGYFPGGASGGMLPASLADIPLDFDTLQPYDCFIGCAAIIVFSQKDSARELATNAMQFFAHESCGQCTPCRVGTEKAVQLMQQDVWDQPLLKELSQVMGDASICGLGQAAPNPLLCAMKYFPQEFA